MCLRTGKCAGRARPTSMTAPHRYRDGGNSVKPVYMYPIHRALHNHKDCPPIDQLTRIAQTKLVMARPSRIHHVDSPGAWVPFNESVTPSGRGVWRPVSSRMPATPTRVLVST